MKNNSKKSAIQPKNAPQVIENKAIEAKENQDVTNEITTEEVLKSSELAKIDAAVKVTFASLKSELKVSTILTAIFATMAQNSDLNKIVRRVLEYGKFTDLVTDDNVREAKQTYLRVVQSCAKYRNEDGRICQAVGKGGGLYKFEAVTTEGKLISLFVSDTIQNIWRKTKTMNVKSTEYYERDGQEYKPTEKSVDKCQEIEAKASEDKKTAKEVKAFETAKQMIEDAGYIVAEKYTFKQMFDKLANENPTLFRKLCTDYMAKFQKVATKKDA